MTPRQRAYLLFKRIDLNTRGLAKLTSAVLYLSEECDVDVVHDVPDLMVAMRNLVRERRNLREALEAELLAQRQTAAAAKAAARR